MSPLNPEEELAHKNAKNCWICEEALAGDSVKDHCHITGKYKGAAHNKCNLQLKIKVLKLGELYYLRK